MTADRAGRERDDRAIDGAHGVVARDRDGLCGSRRRVRDQRIGLAARLERAVGPIAAVPALASLWGWMPLFLLIAVGCLYLPETRRFGAGLLVSGAVVGITVALVFSGSV